MTFWLQSPNILFTNLDVIPKSCMNNTEKLNAISRLIIVIAIVLFIMGKSKIALYTLAIGFVAVIVIYNMFVKVVKKEKYVYPREYTATDYEPVAPGGSGVNPAGASSMPSYASEISPEMQEFVNQFNAGTDAFNPNVQPFQTPVGNLRTQATGLDPNGLQTSKKHPISIPQRLDDFEQAYTPFAEDTSGDYRKVVPMGAYLHSYAQQNTQRMNNQMNHLQREKMFRIQRTMNRHISNQNGMPEFGMNVNYVDA